MNKQIERRLYEEAEKRYPFDVKDGLYGKPKRVGMYNENEIFTNNENLTFPLARVNRSKAITQSYIDHPELRQIRAETFRKTRYEQIAKSRRNKKMA